MDYLEETRLAVERSHRCEAVHLRTVAVREMAADKVAWEGNVEVFLIIGHPQAKRCFAWGYANAERGGKFDFVTVPAILPVYSAETAVKATLVAAAKPKQDESLKT